MLVEVHQTPLLPTHGTSTGRGSPDRKSNRSKTQSRNRCSEPIFGGANHLHLRVPTRYRTSVKPSTRGRVVCIFRSEHQPYVNRPAPKLDRNPDSRGTGGSPESLHELNPLSSVETLRDVGVSGLRSTCPTTLSGFVSLSTL